ncbi:helix-hairpin-helix domain-containing protein [Parapedobacter sp. 10938]|uniref:helix-hairpin-helix domain-containing protein n=1 Tax=Parapedobacter flavus TaxID=3110225 RepID=UPI002DBCDF32|nr:helix-hairpin-helix domain-containing protein [Parapedobacter sp. 10938]MEC3880890.1 helix-hairpin-helix domain-containing protein [Parapedobacter sp. 10938]
MDNKKIAKTFRQYAQLMELHGDNPFRTKAMAAAAFKLDKLPFAITAQTISELSEVPGIGQRTAEKIDALLATGSFPELDALLAATPEGILEMLTIKGLGPKKVKIIWSTLGIESIGELYYACNENRLIEAKGFGLKTQLEIKQAIEFSIANKGWFLYANAEKTAESTIVSLRELLPTSCKIAFTGEFRRKCEVLQSVDFVTEASVDDLVMAIGKIDTPLIETERTPSLLSAKNETGLIFRFFLTTPQSFYHQLLTTTGSNEHLRELEALLPKPQLPDLDSEEAIYATLGLSYIPPELREGNNEVTLAKSGALPTLVSYADLRGTLHNHSTYSDGVNTLEEMARYCRDELRLEYLGICDHSRAAVYAKGLDIQRVQTQWAEIDILNTNLAPFRIFKGIESDILGDGSLDYPDEILAGFDFVVASVHSNLKMDQERATDRLIRAIENPYTTMLGHPTGRLLLSRSGYPLDYERIIDACAAHGVVIEINANPLRLDLDWRWHRYAIEKGVLLSINPDAHRNSGFHDMQYGVHVARKGGVAPQHCLNTFSVDEITEYFTGRKQRIAAMAAP